jgi:two-component system phosphate regulon response regulator PhoB
VQLILVLSGENQIRDSIRYFLEQANYTVRVSSEVRDVMARAERQHPALIFVELGGTTRDGRDLYKTVRSISWLASVPVILFSSATNGDESHNRIFALESGADDYIGASFTRREVIARVQALLRRFRQASPASLTTEFQGLPSRSEGLPCEVININDVRIDAAAMKVFVRGLEVTTTTLEFRLIYYLAKNQYRVFTRDQLLDAVWDGECVTQRTVDACIRRIRRKIEPDRNQPVYLKTVRGAGYLLEVPDSSKRGTFRPSTDVLATDVPEMLPDLSFAS